MWLDFYVQLVLVGLLTLCSVAFAILVAGIMKGR